MRHWIFLGLLASLVGCKPSLSPDMNLPGKDWDVIITTSNGTQVTPHKFRIKTTRPVEHVQAAAALCADFVHSRGVESIGDCLREQGFKPIYIMQ